MADLALVSDDSYSPENAAFYEARIGLATEVLSTELARLRQAVEVGRISLCSERREVLMLEFDRIDHEVGLLINAINQPRPTTLTILETSLENTDQVDQDEQPNPESTTDLVAEPEEMTETLPEQGSEIETENEAQKERTFEELYLQALNELAIEKRIPAGEEMIVNIGAIVRTIYGGNTEPDNFHNIIQWINTRPEFVSRDGSVYRLIVPGEIEVASEAPLTEAMFGRMRVEIKNRTSEAIYKLHVNQVISELNLSGIPRKKAAQLIEGQILTIPIRWMRRDGSFYEIFLSDDPFVIEQAVSERMVSPISVNDPDPEDTPGLQLTTEQLLGFFIHQIERDIVSACTGEVPPRVIDLRKNIPSISELSPEDYSEFTAYRFEIIRTHIKETLQTKGINVEWEIKGNTQGRRYRLIIVTPPKPQPEPRAVQPRAERLQRPVHPDKPAVNEPIIDASTIDKVRNYLGRYKGYGQHKKGAIVREICDGTSLDSEIVQTAIKTLVDIGFVDQESKKGSPYLSIK